MDTHTFDKGGNERKFLRTMSLDFGLLIKLDIVIHIVFHIIIHTCTYSGSLYLEKIQYICFTINFNIYTLFCILTCTYIPILVILYFLINKFVTRYQLLHFINNCNFHYKYVYCWLYFYVIMYSLVYTCNKTKHDNLYKCNTPIHKINSIPLPNCVYKSNYIVYLLPTVFPIHTEVKRAIVFQYFPINRYTYLCYLHTYIDNHLYKIVEIKITVIPILGYMYIARYQIPYFIYVKCNDKHLHYCFKFVVIMYSLTTLFTYAYNKIKHNIYYGYNLPIHKIKYTPLLIYVYKSSYIVQVLHFINRSRVYALPVNICNMYTEFIRVDNFPIFYCQIEMYRLLAFKTTPYNLIIGFFVKSFNTAVYGSGHLSVLHLLFLTITRSLHS
jgi:hypothetical protein